MRYLLRFSYGGTKFYGFQRQKDVKSVQGTLENALSTYFQEEIKIKGSGRTDAGVHAIGQTAHFDVNKKITKKDIRQLNIILKKDIVIKSFKLVPNDFHARFLVKKKIYIYKINVGKFSEKKQGYFYQVPYKLDMKKMQDACNLLVGTHDYQNFVSGIRDDYVSTIFKIKLKKRCNNIIMTFVGVGFYRYMVRHLVGAIIDVGRGKATLQDIEDMLNKPKEYKNLSVAPPEGLYLKKILYVSNFCDRITSVEKKKNSRDKYNH